MSWVPERNLGAAISNAGGFGVIACGAMTPALLDAEIIREVLAAPHEKDTVTLCVDRNLDNPLNDPDDVTRVRCVGDRIERVGKVLRDHNAIDTGVFYRSEERRVGKECVSTCRSRWSPFHYKKNVLK